MPDGTRVKYMRLVKTKDNLYIKQQSTLLVHALQNNTYKRFLLTRYWQEDITVDDVMVKIRYMLMGKGKDHILG